jgi:hypothetical protein
MQKKLLPFLLAGFFLLVTTQISFAQGVTTAALNGVVLDTEGNGLPNANVIAVHIPTGTQYGTSTRQNGQYNIQNMKVGGPYTLTVSYIGFSKQTVNNVFLNLALQTRIDFNMKVESVEGQEIVVTGEKDEVFNGNRTGAETIVNPRDVVMLPSIKRSTRDLIRIDPRSDGNYSFGGKNWLYNSISLDGSYFNNSFGLDDPAPGGQTNAEPIPFDAVEQVQVSVAPFDVREGGFTGAGINTVTKSGTNHYTASLYSFYRDQNFVGNKVSGQTILANPDLFYNLSGFSASGPLLENKVFLFINGEIERREDPGSNFVASRGTTGLGISRVDASVMDQIRQRMIDVYGYDPGPYENYIHKTENEKILAKLDWNINDFNSFTFRFSRLNASRDLPPHPFVLSAGGRGPNANSLPFKNSGYQINNELNSFALELNSRGQSFSNRFFASYNQFRDHREPFSEPFPTIEIVEDGITYTTIGLEPFSANNILDQDVIQVTDNFSYFVGSHVLTVGGNFEYFNFFNSFNIFRNGVFFLPDFLDFIGGARFSSLADFFARTDPALPDSDRIDFRGMIGSGPFKGEKIEVAQISFYVQDEYLVSTDVNLIFGLRVDVPMYLTDPVDNPFSRSLTLLDENDKSETLDQSKLPDAQPLFSPRFGFNWDLYGDRTTQIRGGSGVFTGRLPFVWIGNVISNPGQNPNLYPASSEQIATGHDAILQQSFDLNAMVEDFKWPQVWTTNLAVDQKFPWDLTGTFEVIFGKDINSIYVRNADLVAPVRYLPDGRPYYGGAGANELNNDGSGAGVYVIDNSSKGYNFSFSTQLRKQFDFGLNSFFSYSFLDAKNLMKSTEIASVLWSENPNQGDPNKPDLSYSEFGNRHRFILGGTYRKEWSENFATSFGLFAEVAEGNRFEGAGGNRYSFVYAGDVNGDGSTVNDLIYIPENQSDIEFDPILDENNTVIVTAAQQWEAFNAFIEQDSYLKNNRGKIAERFGGVNPWFFNVDLRLLQDFAFFTGKTRHAFQLSVDILNVPNLLNSDWGVRSIANSAATSPLQLVRFNSAGAPVFNYTANLDDTFTDDPGIKSRWQIQLGLRYIFN